jgi:hypothetical protein
MYFNYKFKKACFIFNLHANYYINKPNIPYLKWLHPVVNVVNKVWSTVNTTNVLYFLHCNFLHAHHRNHRCLQTRPLPTWASHSEEYPDLYLSQPISNSIISKPLYHTTFIIGSYVCLHSYHFYYFTKPLKLVIYFSILTSTNCKYGSIPFY